MKKSQIQQIEQFLDLNLDNFISTYVFKDQQNIDEVLEQVQKTFNLKNYPYKIVCLDISHTNWKNPAWWLSAMLWGLIHKSSFRKFKIPEELGGNDYESLKFCVNKFFKNNTTDLFVLDWALAQLGIVKDLPNDIVLNVDFVSIWKWKARQRSWKMQWETEIFYTFDKEIPVDYDNFIHKLFLKLRNHSHDFANSYRKKLQKLK